jgi:lysyl-tRNA synthetase class 2
MSPDRASWWQPERHRDRRPRLLQRNAIRAEVRRFLQESGFIEVEAGILQVSPGNETHLHAFATSLVEDTGEARTLYLHTSPEFACKKLLAAGETKLFDFARVFRNRDRSPTHLPEFTMLEWYRAGEALPALMADCAEILRRAARTTGIERFAFRGSEADPFAEPERVTVADAFADHAGIDLLATVSPEGVGDRDALAEQARSAGLRVTAEDDWSDIVSGVLVSRIEPRLGRGRATFLTDYPLPEAALARRSPHDPRVAERFELDVCGLELANAFGELTDPVEQRRRFVAAMDEKQRLYGERYPIDEEFLAALAAMPPASGIALGFDRLVMLATGATRIDDVVWTPLGSIAPR